MGVIYGHSFLSKKTIAAQQYYCRIHCEIQKCLSSLKGPQTVSSNANKINIIFKVLCVNFTEKILRGCLIVSNVRFSNHIHVFVYLFFSVLWVLLCNALVQRVQDLQRIVLTFAKPVLPRLYTHQIYVFI